MKYSIFTVATAYSCKVAIKQEFGDVAVIAANWILVR